MSETTTEPVDFDDEPQEDNDNFRQLRNAQRRAERERDRLRDENEALRKQVAFSSAGLNLSEKQQAALLAAHGESDWTADALKATAVELGFAQAEPVVDADTQRREAAAVAQAQVGAAQAGGQPPAPLPDLPTQIIAAEQAGDWDTAMQLKAQQVARLANFGA